LTWTQPRPVLMTGMFVLRAHKQRRGMKYRYLAGATSPLERQADGQCAIEPSSSLRHCCRCIIGFSSGVTNASVSQLRVMRSHCLPTLFLKYLYFSRYQRRPKRALVPVTKGSSHLSISPARSKHNTKTPTSLSSNQPSLSFFYTLFFCSE
jgi:hypothetical protein